MTDDVPMIRRELHTVKDDTNEKSNPEAQNEGFSLLSREQEARVSALYHAKSILEVSRSGGFGQGTTKTTGCADDVIAVAEYIVTGDMWFDDPEKGKEPASE